MNPRRRGKRPDLARATEAYQAFQWGRPAKRVTRAALSPQPKALAKLGTLEAVTYRTTKGKTGRASYEHTFGETGKRRPILALDPHSDRLHIVGGDYTVTARGIED